MKTPSTPMVLPPNLATVTGINYLDRFRCY
jgi:hypothetical protein